MEITFASPSQVYPWRILTKLEKIFGIISVWKRLECRLDLQFRFSWFITFKWRLNYRKTLDTSFFLLINILCSFKLSKFNAFCSQMHSIKTFYNATKLHECLENLLYKQQFWLISKTFLPYTFIFMKWHCQTRS